jgi:hypothetical protein
MSMPSSQYVLAPLRSAASELRGAALAAQNDVAGGAKDARNHLQAGLTHALSDVAKSNARLQAAVDNVAAVTRASAESVLKGGQHLGRSANRRFFGLRKQAVSRATDALDNTMQYSRDVPRKVQKAAIDATSWAARNPRLVIAVAITACCVAFVGYRRRRKALAAAAKKPGRRQTKSVVERAATSARAATPRQRRANGAAAAAK